VAVVPQITDSRRVARWSVPLSLLGALAWLLAGAASPAHAATKTFLYTGAEQMFMVPAGVTSVQVTAIGASGGTGVGNNPVGGLGERVSGEVNVTPGQPLYVIVGGGGQDGEEGGEGGFNGGGAGGSNQGAGGGGASDVRTVSCGLGCPGGMPSLESRLLVAAGGGGGGGVGTETGGGAGGDAGSAGTESDNGGNGGGGAGTETEGGAAGGGEGGIGEPGDLGLGGIGANTEISGGGGGGGGAGLFGGGGGGAGFNLFGGGGGGGGFSLVPEGGAMQVVEAAPKVEITYTLVPPSIEIVSPAEGGAYTQGQAVNAIYSCTPPEGAGVATCAGPVANGAAIDTAILGPHEFTVEAEDTDGAKASKTVNYTVVSPPPVVPTTPPAAPKGSASPVGTALAARVAKVKGGKALLKLRCRGGRCGGVAKLQVGGKLIGKARFSIAAGKAKMVRVKLNGRGKKLLRHARRHRLQAKLRGRGVKPRTVVLK
jgi:Glycine rich protein